MWTIGAVVIFSLAAMAAAPSDSAGPARDDNLVWSDEFDGQSLDLAKWGHYCLGRRRDAIDVKEAVSLDGQGHLLLTTSKVGEAWHTAMISTQGKFERAFGYFECRVRFQTQVGHWSAFWLMPQHIGKVIGNPNASGTEIDIFEYLVNRGDKIQHTLHWDGYGKDHKSAKQIHEEEGLSRGWHTIGLEWTKNEYVFYVDGKETWRTDQAVSHAPEFIILSLEVGDWAGNIAKATLPDSLVVDYVRVYKTRPTEGGSR